MRMNIAEVEALTVPQILQCLAVCDSLAWYDEQAELDRISDDAVRRALGGR